MNRRQFLKGILGSAVLAGSASPPVAASIQSHNPLTIPSLKRIKPGERLCDRRIFCQFDNQELETEIERCATEIGCEVLYGEPFSLDILILGAFIYIIDRNLVGKDIWEEYARFCDEGKWDEPCLIVDNIKDMSYPKLSYVLQCDLNDPASITSILYVIKESKIQNLLKRLR